MPLEYKVGLHFPAWMTTSSLPADKLQALADARKQQVLEHLQDGGNGEIQFILNAAGRKPLGGGAGPLAESLVAFVQGQAFGVRSGFVGANVLLKGTVGKGGELPSIRPRQAKALRFTVGNVVRFALKVDLPPRPYLSMSHADRVELAGVLFGKTPQKT